MGKRLHKLRKGMKYVSNGNDAVTAGKIGLAGCAAYAAHYALNNAKNGLQKYSPGYVIRKARTETEKGMYHLDKKVEREIKKLPGGDAALSLNEKAVRWMWDKVGVSVGSPEKERTQKFYERINVPLPYAKEKTTITETRVPSRYNADAANQAGLLSGAGLAVNALLGVYAAKEGAKYLVKKLRRKKND